MKRIRIFATILMAAPMYVSAGESSDALIVLTTVGYLTGAADGCKVVPSESNALASGMALAIGKGQYGKPAEAHALPNNARQRGASAAASKSVDCAKIAQSIRQYVRDLQK